MKTLVLKLLSLLLDKFLNKFGDKPELSLRIIHHGLKYYLQVFNPTNKSDYVTIKDAIFLYPLNNHSYYDKLPSHKLHISNPKDASSNRNIAIPIWLNPNLILSDDHHRRYDTNSSFIIHVKDKYKNYILEYPSNKSKSYNKFSWKLFKYDLNKKLKNRTKNS